jgi:hypothetical protein
MIHSSIIYYIEVLACGQESKFASIPHSFWWAIISFTTVGYGKYPLLIVSYLSYFLHGRLVSRIFQGDLVPASYAGKLAGSFLILSGILVAILPIPILGTKFEKVYKEYSKKKHWYQQDSN